MNKEILIFGDTGINKPIFHYHKSPILIVDIDKMIFFKKTTIKSWIKSAIILKKDLIANQSTMKNIYKLKQNFMKAELIQIFTIMDYIKVLIAFIHH